MNDRLQKISELTPSERKALMVRLNRGTRRRATSKSFRIPARPADRRHTAPLSFAQERLWFLHQFDPASALYNLSSAALLKGDLALGALNKAFTELIRRHEILRTTYPLIGGLPIQVVESAATVTVPVIDLGSLEDDRRRSEAQKIIALEAERPFDLAAGPNFRPSLLKL